jgi:hypothetical protein
MVASIFRPGQTWAPLNLLIDAAGEISREVRKVGNPPKDQTRLTALYNADQRLSAVWAEFLPSLKTAKPQIYGGVQILVDWMEVADNRMNVLSWRYNAQVREYNTLLLTLPETLRSNFKERPLFGSSLVAKPSN